MRLEQCKSMLSRNQLNIILTILLLQALFLIWHFKYLPLADLPRHMLAAKIVAQYDNPETAYSKFFVKKAQWNPYASYYWFAASAEPVLGILNATRLYLSLAFVLTIIAFRIWIRAISSAGEAQAIPGILLLFGFYFYCGLLNFLFSAPFFFLSLTLAWKLMKNRGPCLRLEIGLAACLLAAYFSHIVTFGLAVMMIFAYWLLFFRNRTIWALIRTVTPALTAFLLYMSLRSKDEPPFTLSWEPLSARLEKLLWPFNIFLDGGKWIIQHEWVFVWVCVLFLMVFSYLTSKSGGSGNSGVRIVGASTALLVGAALLLPSYIAGGLGIALRAPYFAAFSFIGLLPSKWFEKAATRLFMVLLCLILPMALYSRLNTFQSEMLNLEQVVRAIPPAMLVQPVITEPQSTVFHTYPFLHASEWYSYYKGGYSPYLFPSQSNYFPVASRKEFLPGVPGEWQMDEFLYDRHHSNTNYFLVKTKRKEILEDLRRNVPVAAVAGEWQVYGPRQRVSVE